LLVLVPTARAWYVLS